MLQLEPNQPGVQAMAKAPPTPVPTLTVRPQVAIRPATQDEQVSSRVWRGMAHGGNEPPEVAEFQDGRLTHAPEVIAAYKAQAAELPADFLLIYLTRGAQVLCPDPLLPSLLYLTGHHGQAHALRRDARQGLSRDVIRFARALTPARSAALIIDDRQLRLAAPGQITPAPVDFYHFLKPGPAPRSASGGYQ